MFRTPLEKTELKLRQGIVGNIRDSALSYYYALPAEQKRMYVDRPEAKQLLTKLPNDVRDTLLAGFFEGKSKEQAKDWDLVYDYFGNNSEIITELREDPGTDSMLRRMYSGEGADNFYPRENIGGPIDSYFLKSPSGGQALKNRFRAVVEYLKRDFKEDPKNRFLLNLGSGSGGDIITALVEDPILQHKVESLCVDNNPKTVKIGENFAQKVGVEENVKFENASIFKLGYRENVDSGLLIGFLCGLDYPTCVKALRKIKPYFKPGGKLVSASLTEKMLEDDFFCAYILRETANWGLHFPLFGRLKLAYEEAGYDVRRFFRDEPTNFYEIVEAKVKV